MQFHEKLYTLRKQSNMTQTDLAERLNVSRQAVSRWEMGTALPEVGSLIAISDLFCVTLDELLKNRESTPEDVPEHPGELPLFRTFLPKKWWIPLAGAAVSKLLSWGLWVYFYCASTSNRPNIQNWLEIWVRYLEPLLTKAANLFLLWFVLVIGWTLLKWWKAKK